jgi:hypothetical protein
VRRQVAGQGASTWIHRRHHRHVRYFLLAKQVKCSRARGVGKPHDSTNGGPVQGRSYSVGPVSVDTDDLGRSPCTCSPVCKNDPIEKKQFDPSKPAQPPGYTTFVVENVKTSSPILRCKQPTTRPDAISLCRSFLPGQNSQRASLCFSKPSHVTALFQSPLLYPSTRKLKICCNSELKCD